jgi:hypothetical protein
VKLAAPKDQAKHKALIELVQLKHLKHGRVLNKVELLNTKQYAAKKKLLFKMLSMNYNSDVSFKQLLETYNHYSRSRMYS